MRSGAVRKYKELYQKYPMTVVRATSFLCGVPFAAVNLLVIHELFGFNSYQFLYTPVIAALACVHCFFLRKAAASHIRTDHENWDSRSNSFYMFYYRFLTGLLALMALAAVCSLIGL